MIDAIAIISGTTARNEPYTNASTASAPTPPITALSSSPEPSSSAPASSSSASKPVSRTGSPATVAPSSAAEAASSAAGFSPNCEAGSGCG